MPASMDCVFETASPEATLAFGRQIGLRARPGTVVALVGPLGAGKTQWVKGVAAGLGVSDVRVVCSPTFVIIREHQGRLRLYHVDTYRVSSADIAAIGFDEMCKAGGVVVVEWADRILDILPDDCLTITFEPTGAERRLLTCRASGPLSESLLADVQNGR
jgi:tRNA threonylcarbamoyladenosine biosynthesis protein TsaE